MNFYRANWFASYWFIGLGFAGARYDNNPPIVGMHVNMGSLMGR